MNTRVESCTSVLTNFKYSESCERDPDDGAFNEQPPKHVVYQAPHWHMDRRAVLGLMTTGVPLLSGCTQPTVTERPSGEIDIVFSTEATRDVLFQVELIDADGNIEAEFETGFPPDQEGAPSYFSAGLSNGPYTVVIETEAEREAFEWSIADCQRLDVDVTILADEQVEIERTCSNA